MKVMLLFNIAFFTATMVAMESELDPTVKSNPIVIIGEQEPEKDKQDIAAGSFYLLCEKRRKMMDDLHNHFNLLKEQRREQVRLYHLSRRTSGLSPLRKMESAKLHQQ